MSSSWHSYPSIFNLGHAALNALFLEPVAIQEKVDGSQFSFGTFGGELRCRSKGQQLVMDAPEKMFSKAVETARRLQPLLVDGWTYRGEFFEKPKQNALAYSRVPEQHIILFDVNRDEEDYLPYEELEVEATRLGLEAVPLIHVGNWFAKGDELLALLDRESILGGVTIEGVVVKSLSLFGKDKKRLMGKFVSEKFKETHNKEWKKSNPTGGDVVQSLIENLKSEARWQKAVQHLREVGRIEDSPRDIGPLINEIKADIVKEERERIEHDLYRWAIDKVLRGAMAGFPEWYKEQLLARQFEEVTPSK